MITFIVTTYNLEDWLLRRCLKSIITQGLEDYEIIVVDDESAVSPQPVIEEFTSQANIRLYTQKHSRQGAARNLALSHAQGEWIEFVDGDDYLFPHTVKHCLAMAEGHALDLLMFGYKEVWGRDPQPAPSPIALHSPIMPGHEYMRCNTLFGSCCTLLFRRALCDATPYGSPLRFTEHTYIEDEEFVTRLVWRAQRMATTGNTVYAYYQRSNSTTHNTSHQHQRELVANYFTILRRLQAFEATLVEPHEGVTRKVRFLAIDILRRALRAPQWRQQWGEATQQLHTLGLYPLPQAQYTYKYTLFSILSRTTIGREILHLIENLLNR